MSAYVDPVFLTAKDKPFLDAVRELAGQTGASIVIDGRASEQAKKPVTAALYQAPLRSALRVLADMVELKVVAVDNILYVTTPENADKLAKEEAAAKPPAEATPAPPKRNEQGPPAK